MFVVTNREVDKNKKEFEQFGKLAAAGSNVLRLAEAKGQPGRWNVKILPDNATEEMKAAADLKGSGDFYASDYAAGILKARLRAQAGPRNLLLFVHGFNNDVKAVLNRAHTFEKEYDVAVIPFCWPANGGGAWGVASYKSDKRDALESAGSLDRCIERIGYFIQKFNEERLAEVTARARVAHPDNKEKENAYISRAMARECPIKVSVLFHSMGNYLFKHLLQSSTFHARDLVFENVILAAADTNNEGHHEWVDQIRCRNRVYITINENDSALRVSRLKGGEEQLARLGHYTYGLNSEQGVYVDLTNARHVGDSHAYFEGTALNNAALKRFFKLIVNGETAEKHLIYNAAKNLYTLK